MRAFWRALAIFLFGGVLGTGFGVALGFFLFPYVFPPPPANEQLTQADVAPLASARSCTALRRNRRRGSADLAAAPAPATGDQRRLRRFQSRLELSSMPIRPIRFTGAGERSALMTEPFSWSPISRSDPGPKFHVYLVPKASVRREADVKDAMYVDLGRLRAFKGSQRYPIPDGVDVKKYESVVIWCERFGVLITPADLKLAKR